MVDGGTPVTVVDDAFYNWSPVWSADGRFLYYSNWTHIFRLDVPESLTKVDEPPFEYACHEGNLAMRFILGMARDAEAAAAK